MPGQAPASPPTVTGFLGGRGGSQCRVTPTPNHFGRFTLWLAGGSDRPRFLLLVLGRGVPPLGPTGVPSAVGGGISSGSGDLDREALSLEASATTFSLM